MKLHTPLVACVALAASFIASTASAQFAYIDADVHCGEDGNAHISWEVTSYDAWSIGGENELIVVQIMVDGSDEWVEVDRGALRLPEMFFEGSTALPDGALTVMARSEALVDWGNGYPPEGEPRYADLSWKHISFGTVFDIPQDCGFEPPPGVAPARFWKKHPEYWPNAAGVEVGGVTYTIDEAIEIIDTKVHHDHTYKLARQVIAAQLNVDEGNDSSCIAVELADAHTWLLNNPPGSDIRGKDAVWKTEGKALMKILEEYNDGDLCAPERVGTASVHYWKNHEDAWPVTGLVLGGVSYNQADIIDNVMLPSERADRTYRMARVLAATELNIAVGNDGSCISDTVAAAHNWLIANPLGSEIRGKDDAWHDDGKLITSILRDYNRGRMCAAHR